MLCIYDYRKKILKDSRGEEMEIRRVGELLLGACE